MKESNKVQFRDEEYSRELAKHQHKSKLKVLNNDMKEDLEEYYDNRRD